MMKLKNIGTLMILFMLLLSGCSNTETSPSTDQTTLTPLMTAAKDGDVERLHTLLIDDPTSVNTINDESDKTALIYAISSDEESVRLEMVKLLLDAEANINLVGPKSTPPLSESILQGDKQIFDLLMSYKPDIEMADWDGATPLMYAAGNGHNDIIDALLVAGADINKQDFHTFYTVDHALLTGMAETADYLRSKNGKSIMDSLQTTEDAIQLMKTAEVEETQDYLYFQVVYNNLLLTKLMLMAGYELDYRMEEMMYDLARMNNIEMMRLLLAAGADPDEDDVTTGTTSLINASKNGHINVVSLLLEYGADPDIMDSDGKTALIYAEENGYTSIVDILAKSLNSANTSDTSITDDVEEDEHIAETTKTGAYSLDKSELLQVLYEEATTGYINGIKYGVLESKDINLGELKTGDVVQALGEPMEEYIEGGIWDMYYEAGDYILNISFDFTSSDASEITSNVSIAVSAP